MKVTSFLPLALASAATADYVCPANPSMTDAQAIAYGYTIQGLIESYYHSVPVNASFFSDIPMASMMASNGMTIAKNTVTNVEGLGKQAMLGAEALMMMGGMLGLSPPKCSFTYPMAPNGTAHLMNAFYLEATLCGAFIGLADYFQSPTLNSLSARLAAEHGIHAAALQAMMQPVGFMPSSTTLTPAFTPDMVMQSGMEVGMLGSYLGGCVKVPMAPCGGMVAFGPLLSNLTDQSAMMSNSTMMASGSMTMTGSMTSGAPGMVATASGSMRSTTQSAPAVFTGEASSLNAGAGVGAAALVMAFQMI
jgi:hypothetical protein